MQRRYLGVGIHFFQFLLYNFYQTLAKSSLKQIRHRLRVGNANLSIVSVQFLSKFWCFDNEFSFLRPQFARKAR